MPAGTRRLRGNGVATSGSASERGDSAGVKKALDFAVLLRLARVRLLLYVIASAGVA